MHGNADGAQNKVRVLFQCHNGAAPTETNKGRHAARHDTAARVDTARCVLSVKITKELIAAPLPQLGNTFGSHATHCHK